LGVPNQAGLIAVTAGLILAAIAGFILRRRADRRAVRELQQSKKLSVEVIRSSEQMLNIAAQPGSSDGPSPVVLFQDNSQFRAAVRRLTGRTPSAPVLAALAELEHARLQVLTAAVARDADYLASAARGLAEAIEAFSAASSIMVRLAPASAAAEVA
jgi:hypothetical protein